MTEWISSGNVHISLSDLMTMEHDYPGVMADIDTLIWQTHLVKEQINPNG